MGIEALRCSGNRRFNHLNYIGSAHPPLLPPANEVWGKVICLQACVCHQGWGGICSWGVCSRGVHGPGGCMVPGGGAWWTPQTATAAGDMHPTGMDSCFDKFYKQPFLSYALLFQLTWYCFARLLVSYSSFFIVSV